MFWVFINSGSSLINNALKGLGICWLLLYEIKLIGEVFFLSMARIGECFFK